MPLPILNGSHCAELAYSNLSPKFNLENLIKIAMQKFSEFIATNQAFRFRSCIKGTPSYWKIECYDLLAMVK